MVSRKASYVEMNCRKERHRFALRRHRFALICSLYCSDTEFWSLSSYKVRLTVWFNRKAQAFSITDLYIFFIWDSMFLDLDSVFFTRWVPGLTTTICNQNHWIYIHVSNFFIEKQSHLSILLHHSRTYSCITLSKQTSNVLFWQAQRTVVYLNYRYVDIPTSFFV